jgi:hypothetical protein
MLLGETDAALACFDSLVGCAIAHDSRPDKMHTSFMVS